MIIMLEIIISKIMSNVIIIFNHLKNSLFIAKRDQKREWSFDIFFYVCQFKYNILQIIRV